MKSSKRRVSCSGVPTSGDPMRHEYQLAEKGIYLWPILISLEDWSTRWGKWPGGEPLNVRHKACGHLTSLKIVCSHCDEPINARDVTQEMSPAMVRERASMAQRAEKRKIDARA